MKTLMNIFNRKYYSKSETERLKRYYEAEVQFYRRLYNKYKDPKVAVKFQYAIRLLRLIDFNKRMSKAEHVEIMEKRARELATIK